MTEENITYGVYLTCYYGNKLPPFYIGYSTMKKLRNGYRGSPTSKKYCQIFKEEKKKNPHLFKTKILSEHKLKSEALEKESKFQKALQVHKNPLYINMAIFDKKISRSMSGPDHHFYGKKFSEEHKKKMSESMSGRNFSDDHKQKLSESQSGIKSFNYGKAKTSETRQKMSNSKKGVNHPNFGKHLSEETKKKISSTNKGKLHSEEDKKKMSDLKKIWWARQKCLLKLEKN